MSILKPFYWMTDQYAGLDKELLRGIPAHILATDPRIQIDTVSLEALVLLDQVHGSRGTWVSEQDIPTWQSLSVQGDYLITDMPSIGLAIATADCVPILLYHPTKPLIAAVHAGWRGLAQGVVGSCIQDMLDGTTLQPGELHAVLGPAARHCCYAIGTDLATSLVAQNPSIETHIYHRHAHVYLDMIGWAQAVLRAQGVQYISYIRDPEACTIHNISLCSHRRNPQSTQRNITIIALV